MVYPTGYSISGNTLFRDTSVTWDVNPGPTKRLTVSRLLAFDQCRSPAKESSLEDSIGGPTSKKNSSSETDLLWTRIICFNEKLPLEDYRLNSLS